ncbi:hypothetical protein DB354_02270 [Opitutus sp. ER46]|nr:hypothetical protein DB354_02270 [Opitutus sp. ER46]
MRRRLQVILAFLAWFLATGCQWDVAQLVAWGNMFSGYVTQMTVGAAVEKTFSGEMCRMCRAVQQRRQEHERNHGKTPGARASGKLVELYPPLHAAAVVPPATQHLRYSTAASPMLGRGRACPPLPPPRAA